MLKNSLCLHHGFSRVTACVSNFRQRLSTVMLCHFFRVSWFCCMLTRAGGTTKKAAVLAKLATKASLCESLQIFKHNRRPL